MTDRKPEATINDIPKDVLGWFTAKYLSRSDGLKMRVMNKYIKSAIDCAPGFWEHIVNHMEPRNFFDDEPNHPNENVYEIGYPEGVIDVMLERKLGREIRERNDTNRFLAGLRSEWRRKFFTNPRDLLDFDEESDDALEHRELQHFNLYWHYRELMEHSEKQWKASAIERTKRERDTESEQVKETRKTIKKRKM